MGETALKMALLGGLACAGLGCTDEIVLGEQCPNPASGNATVAGNVGDTAVVYGTSCAPCDKPLELDARGCPKLVTFESCGGDICVGGFRLSPPMREDEDSGTDGEDGGAD